MKIYNKKGFFNGIFFLLLAVCNTILAIQDHMDFFEFTCIFIGIVGSIIMISRSFSKNASYEDQDELTTHLLQKSRSLAFFWSKALCVFAALFWLMIYSFTKDDIYIILFGSAGFLLVGMILIGAFTEFYCEWKMK